MDAEGTLAENVGKLLQFAVHWKDTSQSFFERNSELTNELVMARSALPSPSLTLAPLLSSKKLLDSTAALLATKREADRDKDTLEQLRLQYKVCAF
jgi:hypothetical protein